MSSWPLTLAAGIGLGAPVAVAVASARKREGGPTAEIAATTLGLGAGVVGIWYAAALAGLGAGSIALGGVAGAVALAPGLRGRRTVVTAARPREVLVLAAIGALLALATAVPFLVHGLERGDQVVSISMTDWGKHLAFAGELAAFDEVPPHNPFLPSAGPAPYYAGFHLLAGLLARAAGTMQAVFPALLGLLFLTVLLLPFVVYETARTLGAGRTGAVVAAAGASLLGGFDMVALTIDAVGDLVAAWPPSADLSGLRELVPSVNPDYWNHHNARQFYPPYRNAIWAPQHLFGALLAVLVVCDLWRASDRPRPAIEGMVAGVGMIATAMISAYTALALGVGLVAVAGLQLARSPGAGERRLPGHWIVAASTALVGGVPFVLQLGSSSSASLTAALSAAGSWKNGALLSSLLGDGALARVLDTPAILLFELGAIGLLGLQGLRYLESSHRGRVATFALAAIALAVFFRPPVGGPNNLYPRALMLVWILLAPAAVAAARRLPRRTVILLLVPCLLYAPYAMIGATLEGYLFWRTPVEDHRVARWTRQLLPPTTRIALHPRHRPANFAYWSPAPVVLGHERLALLFGASSEQVDALTGELSAAYSEADAAVAARTFAHLGAGAVIVGEGQEHARVWASSACFQTLYEAARWLVLEPETDLCPP